MSIHLLSIPVRPHHMQRGVSYYISSFSRSLHLPSIFFTFSYIAWPLLRSCPAFYKLAFDRYSHLYNWSNTFLESLLTFLACLFPSHFVVCVIFFHSFFLFQIFNLTALARTSDAVNVRLKSIEDSTLQFRWYCEGYFVNPLKKICSGQRKSTRRPIRLKISIPYWAMTTTFTAES